MVVVGEAKAGKSCLIQSYINNVFDDSAEATVLDIYNATRNIEDNEIDIEIHDTAGEPAF